MSKRVATTPTNLLAKIRQVPGIADARIQEAFQNPALKVDFNREFAGVVGLTESDAATSMQTTLSGSTQTAPTYLAEPDQRRVLSGLGPDAAIWHRHARRSQKPAAQRRRNSTQLLGGLATFSPEPLDARRHALQHSKRRQYLRDYAGARSRRRSRRTSRRSSTTRTVELPKGATVTIRGQVATMQSAYQQLLIGLAFSIVLIYLLIVVNFQSWLDPFVIIMALPAALAGIVWMLFLTHTSLSVPALTGAIMCMGVATANSILVVSFAREQLAEGKSAVEAALAAGATRFRPVLMTALAMIIGMAPMAIEPGQNSPLGRAVIGGLLFATFATLLFVPTVFASCIAPIRTPPKPRRHAPEPLVGLPSHA